MLKISVTTFQWSFRSSLKATSVEMHHTIIQGCQNTNQTRLVVIVAQYTNLMVWYCNKMLLKIFLSFGSRTTGKSVIIFVTVMALRIIKSYYHGIISVMCVWVFIKQMQLWIYVDTSILALKMRVFEWQWVENKMVAYEQRKWIITYAWQNLLSVRLQNISWNKHSRAVQSSTRLHLFQRKPVSTII